MYYHYIFRLLNIPVIWHWLSSLCYRLRAVAVTRGPSRPPLQSPRPLEKSLAGPRSTRQMDHRYSMFQEYCDFFLVYVVLFYKRGKTMLTRHENTRLFKRELTKIDIFLSLLTGGIKIQGFPKEAILFFIEKSWAMQ